MSAQTIKTSFKGGKIYKLKRIDKQYIISVSDDSTSKVEIAKMASFNSEGDALKFWEDNLEQNF